MSKSKTKWVRIVKVKHTGLNTELNKVFEVTLAENKWRGAPYTGEPYYTFVGGKFFVPVSCCVTVRKPKAINKPIESVESNSVVKTVKSKDDIQVGDKVIINETTATKFFKPNTIAICSEVCNDGVHEFKSDKVAWYVCSYEWEYCD